MMRAAILVLAALALPAAAQPAGSIEELRTHVARLTARVNALSRDLDAANTALASQQSRLTASDAAAAATRALVRELVVAAHGERTYVLDFACKHNTLIANLAASTGSNPPVGPPIHGKACDKVAPAPVWPTLPEIPQ